MTDKVRLSATPPGEDRVRPTVSDMPPSPRRAAPDRLIVLISDALSELVVKGEVTERYYNPGDLFREVHIVLTNDDRPARGDVQPMVGSAELHIHNLPVDASLFRRTLGWRPRLLRPWARGAVSLARELQPQLIRCHGAHLNAFAASEVSRLVDVPYVVSMHTNPDELRRRERGAGDLRARATLEAGVAMERAALSRADCVVCVYRFIEPYARRLGARRVEVIYNVVNGANLPAKNSYSLAAPPHIVVPGRQLVGKDPRPIVEALCGLPDVRCTFVGDGPLHDATVALAQRSGVIDRCAFLRAVPNDDLCRSLRNYDVLVSVNDYGGVSKVELEAALAGMPVVTNQHPLERVPEILDEACLTVSGTPDSYREALQRLLNDEPLRRRLGTAVRENACAVSPPRMEEKYIALYEDLLGGRHAAGGALRPPRPMA